MRNKFSVKDGLVYANDRDIGICWTNWPEFGAVIDLDYKKYEDEIFAVVEHHFVQKFGKRYDHHNGPFVEFEDWRGAYDRIHESTLSETDQNLMDFVDAYCNQYDYVISRKSKRKLADKIYNYLADKYDEKEFNKKISNPDYLDPIIRKYLEETMDEIEEYEDRDDFVNTLAHADIVNSDLQGAVEVYAMETGEDEEELLRDIRNLKRKIGLYESKGNKMNRFRVRESHYWSTGDANKILSRMSSAATEDEMVEELLDELDISEEEAWGFVENYLVEEQHRRAAATL